MEWQDLLPERRTPDRICAEANRITAECICEAMREYPNNPKLWERAYSRLVAERKLRFIQEEQLRGWL
jgi:hypothetical protein